MKYVTPQEGDKISVKYLQTGKVFKGEVSASVARVGFKLKGEDSLVFLDSCRGTVWEINPIVLENK